MDTNLTLAQDNSSTHTRCHPCNICQQYSSDNGPLCILCRPISLNDVTPVECHKCRRIPSTTLNNVRIDNVKKTKFGCNVTGAPQTTVKLCQECTAYAGGGKNGLWRDAWPSVILDFLRGRFNGSTTGRPLLKLLPLTIQREYHHLFANRMSTTDSI